ncbi:YcjX family protein [Vibrio sp.]|uniref:YcjX family protein n=1 Tax=Vibrio sp. TaxID=678 RepID=UPI003D13EFE5
MKRIGQEVNDLINRGLDAHLRVAVTGLSRAGKTAFITSMVNQLLHTSTHDNLPLLDAARERRLIGARRVPQSNVMVPRFSYDEAMDHLQSDPPQWPEPTRDVSEIRLAIKYRSQKRTRKLLGKASTLYLDIIDYPGEWLLDLPLLSMNFEQWSESQLTSMCDVRKPLADAWQAQVAELDLAADADEKQLQQLADRYTDYLHQCKAAGLHWVQPGRFVLPGELAGAPVLQFFPCRLKDQDSAGKQSNYAMLKSRYQQYQQKVVKAFYKDFFATFDRQIVLVDCLTPLNSGDTAFQDMRAALEQILTSFRYGRNHLLNRLFSPKIDKVLFAATKADHVTPEQHANLAKLLQQMIHPAWQHAAYENIDMQCLTMASVQATQSGFITSGETTMAALQGVTLQGEPLTVFPGDVPGKLPSAEFWRNQRFDFTAFRPGISDPDQPLQHIRLDKALQYLLGDKLR